MKQAIQSGFYSEKTISPFFSRENTQYRNHNRLLLTVFVVIGILPFGPEARANCPDPGYSLENENIIKLIPDPVDAETVFAIGDGSSGADKPVVFKSCDGGWSWSATTLTEGSGGAVRSLAIDPTDNNNVFAAGYSLGLLRSRDGGITWSLENNSEIEEIFFAADGTAYAWNNIFSDSSVDTPGQVQRLEPGEADWETFLSPPSGTRAMRVHPTDANWLHTGAAYSVDGGVAWQVLEDVGPLDVKFSSSDPMRMLRTGEPVQLSYDGGITWVDPLPEFTISGYPSRRANGVIVAIDALGPDYIFVVEENCGLYRSLDAGVHWHLAHYGVTGNSSSLCTGFTDNARPVVVTEFVVSPVDGSRMYLVTSDGVFTSVHRGEAWHPANGTDTGNPPPSYPDPWAKSADLSLIYYGAPATFNPPTTVTFRGRITNHGPDPAVGAIFSFGRGRVVSITRGSCNSYSCELGSVASGESIELEFQLKILGGGIGADCNGDAYTISGRVYSSVSDPDIENSRGYLSMIRVGNAPLISSCPGEGLFQRSGGGGTGTFSLPVLLSLSTIVAIRRRWSQRGNQRGQV